MAVNYDDKRFQQVEADKKEALTELEQTYTDLIDKSGKFYQDQIDATNQWAEKQAQLQQAQTDLALQQIEQQKAQARQDYIKQQSGAYTDWKKQSNGYGAEAERMAASGLNNTGYSESSQVSMYNTYQNRVAAAKQSIDRAMLDYNDAMANARLQNDAALAEIAYQALQQRLTLSLQGFQYENSLLLELQDKKTALENTYYARWQDVLDQINTEEALAKSSRSSGSYYTSNNWTDQTVYSAPDGWDTNDIENFQKISGLTPDGQWGEREQSLYEKSPIRELSCSPTEYLTALAKAAQSEAPEFKGSTYNDAVNYLEAYGYSSKTGGLMTAGEWQRHKNKKNSAGGEHEAKTYIEYLRTYVYGATH